MKNYIILGVLLIIVSAALVYIVKEKKKGKKCIGCPDGNSCSGSCAGCTSCTQKEKD